MINDLMTKIHFGIICDFLPGTHLINLHKNLV